MSFQLASEHKGMTTRPSWANASFIVEAMVLLVFLIASLAVFMQLFSASLQHSRESGELTDAVAAASSTAERFAADPQGVPAVAQVGDLLVTCNVKPVKHERGTLYQADIRVYGASTDAADVAAILEAAEGSEAGAADAAGTATSATVAAGVSPVYAITTSAYESEVSR